MWMTIYHGSGPQSGPALGDYCWRAHAHRGSPFCFGFYGRWCTSSTFGFSNRLPKIDFRCKTEFPNLHFCISVNAYNFWFCPFNIVSYCVTNTVTFYTHFCSWPWNLRASLYCQRKKEPTPSSGAGRARILVYCIVYSDQTSLWSILCTRSCCYRGLTKWFVILQTSRDYQGW